MNALFLIPPYRRSCSPFSEMRGPDRKETSWHPIKLVGSAADSIANAGRFFGVDFEVYSTPVSRLGKRDEYDHTACAWGKRRSRIQGSGNTPYCVWLPLSIMNEPFFLTY